MFSTMGSPAPPPPSYHEASAYPALQSPRRLRKVFSVRAGVALLAAVQLSWLYLWALRSQSPSPPPPLSVLQLQQFETGLASCAAIQRFPSKIAPKDRKENPRWNPTHGQDRLTVLRNATLFDGEHFVEHPVDVVFAKGLIVSVSPTGSESVGPLHQGAQEYHLHGAYVTPGLVDMHSHHLVAAWPILASTDDLNEMYGDMGPLTPFLRALDSMKAYDIATQRIASGGVTTSLIIPGSANIMGGEGAVVKNVVRPGPNGEYVVEEMLLEHGIDPGERKRYMKMACGENPKDVYHHTRMGNAWLLREWLARAKELLEKQDAWCEAARGVLSSRDKAAMLADTGGFPDELKLDSTVGMLRGRVAMHNHCYEPEDFEMMLRISDEFGFRVRAFHHAISAWQVPEMLKAYGQNLTIATFAELALYKQEAYAASLSAGKILNDHGIPVAYKSDHCEAQYLLLQSAVGHSFGLPADKALQAVTSVPATSLEIDDRVGYTRPGYDADIVVWDSHPLSAGATPSQVFIDGVATLDPKQVEASTARIVHGQGANNPAMRATISTEARQEICTQAEQPGRAFVITGINKSFLDEYPSLLRSSPQNKDDQLDNSTDLTLVISDGKITCLGPAGGCDPAAAQLYESHLVENNNVVTFSLQDGHVTRGLVAVTSTLGLAEIPMDPATGDGVADVVKPQDSGEDNMDHAKYGVTLAGGQGRHSGAGAKTFARARLGGVTRAVQAPRTQGGLVTGVSTGMRTSKQSTLLNGGLFQADVAVHVALGAKAKANEGTVSMGVQRLRALVKSAKKEDLSTWGLVANGSLPLVIKADSSVISFPFFSFLSFFPIQVILLRKALSKRTIRTLPMLTTETTTTARYPAGHPVQEGFPGCSSRHSERRWCLTGKYFIAVYNPRWT